MERASWRREETRRPSELAASTTPNIASPTPPATAGARARQIGDVVAADQRDRRCPEHHCGEKPATRDRRGVRAKALSHVGRYAAGNRVAHAQGREGERQRGREHEQPGPGQDRRRSRGLARRARARAAPRGRSAHPRTARPRARPRVTMQCPSMRPSSPAGATSPRSPLFRANHRQFARADGRGSGGARAGQRQRLDLGWRARLGRGHVGGPELLERARPAALAAASARARAP